MKRRKTPFYIMLHPIEGFSELRYHKWGSVGVATFLIFLLFISMIANRQLSGFSFTIGVKLDMLNIPLIFTETIGLCLAFTIVNWGICTLFDGNARIKEIWVILGYALLPYIIGILVTTVISHFLTVDEAVFLKLIQGICFAYFVLLLLKGLETYHEYSFGSSIISVVVTLIGILLIVFVGILLFSIAQQFVAFLVTIWQELTLRR